ncbi:alpha/beta hydrolase, partial [Pseudomonas aeruginosa]|nr:alpha/beta hydrolase [Pseudomonas aeruginosa]
MSATPYLLQPPLAVGFARLGFGSLSLESLRERYAAPSSGSRFIE